MAIYNTTNYSKIDMMSITKNQLEKLYFEDNLDVRALAKVLKISYKRACILLDNYNIQRKRKSWNEEDINYIYDNYGKLGISTMAKRLRRSEGSVVSKIDKLKIGPARFNNEFIDLNNLSKALGITNNTLRKRISENNLPAIKKQLYKNYYIWQIDIENFWKWVKINKDLINLSKMEENILGPEEDWVKEKRIMDIKRSCNRVFTTHEDMKIIEMIKERKSYNEIINEIGCTYGMLKKRIKFLNLQRGNPKIRILTDNEILKINRMLYEGVSYIEIAKEFNMNYKTMYAKMKSLELI